MQSEIGTLYIVAIPIGHPKDITLRALDILSSVDMIICEDVRNASRFLKQCGLAEKPFAILSEHTEKLDAGSLVEQLLLGKKAALISDCGTPVFADPGYELIRQATKSGIRVIPLPGPSSLITALSLLDRPLNQFVFGGFLPRENDKRIAALRALKAHGMPIIIMDTPYRLEMLLVDVSKVFSPSQEIMLAVDMTQTTEKIYRGSVTDVLESLEKNKAEFILVIYSSGKK
jgi:16S rRNA (cytidine1402-2'-O)-methyltransferase